MNSIFQIASGTTAAFSTTGRAVGGFLTGFVGHGEGSVSSRPYTGTSFTEDPDDEIDRLRRSVEGHPRDGEVKQALRLAKLGQALFSRYEEKGEREDLDEAITYLSAAMDTVPSGHPHRLLYESNVGLLLCSRFELKGEAADLEKAVTFCQSALRAVSKTNAQRAWYEANYSTALLRRFEKLGSIEDLNKAIDLCLSAYHSLDEGHEDRATYAANMSSALILRFEAKKNVIDLDEAISYALAAVHATPSSEPVWPSYQSSLAAHLYRRYQEHADPADLDQSIDRSHAAVDALHSSHPDRATYQAVLSSKLLVRFEKLGKTSDLDEAIFLAETAASQPTNGNRAALDVVDDPKRYATLSNSLLRRFESTGFVADLDKAISHDRFALKSITTDKRSLERPIYLMNLSTKLFKRFEKFGEVNDLDESIAHVKAALEMTPQDHGERVARLVCASHKLLSRFEWTGNGDDVQEAADLAQAACDLTPLDDANGPTVRYNLAAILLQKHQHLEEGVDLDAVVSLSRSAWQATAVDISHRPLYESLLAVALFARFKKLNHAADLTEAVSHVGAVERTTARSDPNFVLYRSILSFILLAQFELTRDTVDSLDDAIEHGREAILLTSESNPKWCKLQYQLGRALLLRFESRNSHQELDLEDAVAAFRRASSSAVGAPTLRFQAAMVSASMARRHKRPQAALQGYETAMQLIPRVTWYGLDMPKRQATLTALAHDLSTDGVACALNLKQLEIAVEFLENAKEMMLTHALNDRRDVDAAHQAAPAMIDDLTDIANTMERDGHEHRFSFPVLMLEEEPIFGQPPVHTPSSLTPTRSMTPTTPHGPGLEKHSKQRSLSSVVHERRTASGSFRPTTEQEIFGKRYKRMADKFDQIIGDMRRKDGFGDFLRHKSFADLRRVAAQGPVIILSCNRHRCDSLIMAAGRSSVDLVPLEEITSSDVEKWAERIISGAREMTSESLSGPEFERYTLKPVLRDIWEYVFIPVIDKLDTIWPSLSSVPRRVSFYPVGAFAALPIHAAGPHYRGQDGLQDRFNPSYIPTLSSLLRARRPSRNSHTFQILSVSQPSTPGLKPLAGASKQVRFVRELANSVSIALAPLEGKGATTQTVLRAAAQATFVHLACRTEDDRRSPAMSSIQVDDGAVRLEDLVGDSQAHRNDFIFLGGGGNLATVTSTEEIMSLSSSLHFAGVRSTISMMWDLVDASEDTALVVKEVYSHLLRHTGKNPLAGDSGEALGKALRSMETRMPLHRRVSFIHTGL